MATLERLETKLDRVLEEQSRVRVELEKQRWVLDEHQRRSLALEEMVDLVRSELDPLKKHVVMFAGAGKVVTVLAALASIVAAAWKTFG